MKAENQLRRILDYADAFGVTVTFKRSSSMYIPEIKTINIASWLMTQSRVYILLHELGHWAADCDENHERMHPWGEWTRPEAMKNTVAAHVALIAEEIDAWQRGRSLADALGLQLDIKEFEIIKGKFIITYIDAIPRR